MTSSHRRAYVDWARGIAVLVMIEAHTVDAWTRLSPTVSRTIAFRDATVLGGFAAPLFLWLAVELRRTLERAAAARLFHYSLLYLALLFVAMAVDTVV